VSNLPNWTNEQLKAIQTEGKNVIVSAGAGSGKTAVLTERVLRKIKSGISINNLLILTFTNAAAKEMKKRIKKEIKNAKIYDELDKVDNAYITTFDSYALSIVKKYNYILNISKNISIIDQSIIDIKKDEIITEVFDELYKEENPLFLNLIDSFCTKDDSEIKKCIKLINNKIDMIYDKNKYLNDYINTYYNDNFINKKINEYEDLLLNILSNINIDFIKLEEYVPLEYYEKASEILEELLISNNYESIKQNINTLPNLPKNSSSEAKKLKENINEELKKLNEMCIYQNKNEIKEYIYKTKNHIEAIIEIIKRIEIKLNKYKKTNDSYEFIDIAKMAINILENNKSIADEIKNNLNEILIDEYQDTNDLQDLFISYIENNNVYMVGDIKQSIYRFRNANPNLFKSKYESYSKEEQGIKIDLNKNFRSRSEIVNNINLIFDNIMDNQIGGANYSLSHRMVFGNVSYDNEGANNLSNDIEIYNYPYDKNSEYKKEELEIFIIANDIKNKIENHYKVFDSDTKQLRDIKYSDISILIDRSTNFDLYKKIFEYLNIPLTIYKDESLTDSVDIGIIKNIINLIINKNINQSFKYSFVSIMRSYLFNLDDNEIFKYIKNENYNDSELIKLINQIDYKNKNIKELVLEIIDKFNFYEKMITTQDIENHIIVLDYITTLANNLSCMGYTIIDFYNYLDEILNNNYDIKYESFKNKKAVSIMTIHTSKGLEYPICYYSGMYAAFNLKEIKERFLYDRDYGIIVPFYEEGIRTTIYKELLKNKYKKEEISEKIRLFYVALTRAKEKMIIVSPLLSNENNIDSIIPVEERLKYTSFLDILNSIKSKIDIYIKNIDLEKIFLTNDYNFIKKSNYKDIIEITNEVINVKEIKIDDTSLDEKHFSKEIHNLVTKEEINNINLGKNIHTIFENIDFINPNYDGLSNFEKTKVQKFINSGILNNVLNIYKEYEFIYIKDNVKYHGIIDLLLEFENEFKIVDYKLKNITDDAYLNQLNGYKEYIQSITNKPVSIYLYSIIDETLKKL
jgi:ATP-dependent helicase/nuclease subunit A